ncbi:MAG: hypothetical protein H3C34_08990 [Caldilineaceae bacterium]|nr:hypothetical protein [Caldilineaceae bacterium]
MYRFSLLFRIVKVSAWIALGLAALAACGAPQAALPAPAGAASGQHTFIYYYTDN